MSVSCSVLAGWSCLGFYSSCLSEFRPLGITHSTRFEHRGLKHAVSRSSLSLGRGKTRRTEGRRREFTQVQATVRCKTLLLLVWIAMLAELQYNGELVELSLSLSVSWCSRAGSQAN